MIETPHFQIGHMCAGCKISNYLHTGCIVDENVRVVKTETKQPPVKVQEKVVFGVAHEVYITPMMRLNT